MEDYEPTDAEVEYCNDTKKINCKFCKYLLLNPVTGENFCDSNCYTLHPNGEDGVPYEPVDIDEWLRRKDC